uniref:Uncharacterized protein n=1 Tax=uncultured marine virus TaxID=186617 RepID=A0A0F7LB83_9VIRU|nr:hypothetical protein [uncultured marine virus]
MFLFRSAIVSPSPAQRATTASTLLTTLSVIRRSSLWRQSPTRRPTGTSLYSLARSTTPENSKPTSNTSATGTIRQSCRSR